MRAYCKNQTFLLVALDGSQMTTRPNDFNDIPEKFTADPTYKMAVAAGALEPFESAKQGDAIEEAARAPKRKKAAVSAERSEAEAVSAAKQDTAETRGRTK